MHPLSNFGPNLSFFFIKIILFWQLYAIILAFPLRATHPKRWTIFQFKKMLPKLQKSFLERFSKSTGLSPLAHFLLTF